MNTIMYVEDNESGIRFRLDKTNFYRVPPGRIRIARFKYIFLPNDFSEKVSCYYGDIYFKRMIRRWKNKRNKKLIKLRLNEIQSGACILFLSTNLPTNMIKNIVEYL